jgi:uncharacterized membrane protein YqgA involved in biofilm formation
VVIRVVGWEILLPVLTVTAVVVAIMMAVAVVAVVAAVAAVAAADVVGSYQQLDRQGGTKA